jgi:UDP-glucose 4-epimerase
MVDVARALIGNRKIDTLVTGIRPGEKLHEILVSEEESHRTYADNDVYVIAPILPELQAAEVKGPWLEKEYSSETDTMTSDEVSELMVRRDLMVGQTQVELEGEFLR